MRPVLVAAVAAAGQAEAPEGYASQFLSIGWSGSLGAVALPAYTREAKDARAMAEARLSGSGVVAGYHLLFVALTERAPPDLRPFESVAVEVVGVAETREMVAYAPYPEWTADLCTMVDASGVPEGRRVAVRAQCEPWLRATDGRIFAPLESDGDVYQFMVPDAAYKLIPSAGLCRSEDVASPLLVGPGLSGVVEADWPIGWIDVTAHDAVTDGFFLVVSSGSSRATFPWVPGRRVWVSPGTYRAMMLRDGLEESRVHEVRVTEGEGVLVKFDL